MRVVLAYDVVENRRRGRFFMRLKRYLTPVQKSVFEGDLTPPALAKVEALIARELDLMTDQVRVYSVCGACAGLIRTWGPAVDLPDPEAPVIV